MNEAQQYGDPDGNVGLRYWAPPPELGTYFGAIYYFFSDRPEYHDLTRADMPQLRFMVAGGGVYHAHGGAEYPSSDITLIGPTMGATRFSLDRPARVLGVSVLPLGWLALGVGPACDLANRVIPFGQGEGYREFLGALRAEREPEKAVAAMWTFLAGLVTPPSAEDLALVSAIDAWLSESASPRIEDLLTRTHLSARQIARHTNRLYGAAPKLLARKYRALRCAAQIVLDRKGWQDLCDDGTFYDQAHFIREIKQFVGMTPHRLLNDPGLVTRLTAQRRALTGLVSEIHRVS